jgi:hypothetical protein
MAAGESFSAPIAVIVGRIVSAVMRNKKEGVIFMRLSFNETWLIAIL